LALFGIRKISAQIACGRSKSASLKLLQNQKENKEKTTMIRKAILVVMFALSFFATAPVTEANDPIPECLPCPWQK